MATKSNNPLFKQAHSKNWNCRPQWRNKDGSKGSLQVSLGTPDKELAWRRYREIKSRVDDLKSGMTFTWSWQRKSKHTEVKVQTVQNAFDKYLKYQETNGLKPETILGTKDAYRRLMESKCASPSLPIKSLKGIDLEDFKAYWLGKHSPNTISQSLNKIKAFLNYCVDKRWMSRYKSVQSPLKAKPISYFTDEEFKTVIDAMESDELKRAMLFYRETGCRKREPFISRRVGNTLIIPPMKKNPQERRIQLSDIMCSVHDEMVDRFNKRMLKCKSEKAGWDWYYIKLKQACKKVGIGQKTLHDLRDTYIIRLWAITGDIHLVSTEVGHTDIKQTVEYARFRPNELLVHFPSLKKWLKPRIIKANSLMEHTQMEHTYGDLLQVTDGEWTS
jgi:integrase